MKLPFAYIALFLLLVMPFASQAQVSKSSHNELQFYCRDSDLLVDVEVLSLSQRVYEISFKNVGTQVLLVPAGSYVFFHLYANRQDDGSISTASLELAGGIDHPVFKGLDTMEVSVLNPGEAITYTFEERGPEMHTVTPRNQVIIILIGYVIYDGEAPPSYVPYGSFLSSAREVEVIHQSKGEEYTPKMPPNSFGFYGDLGKWKRN
jgi:hypothetical protein